MADFSTISAALSSIKTASEIVKIIRESNVSIAKAEMKLKLADLMEALADTRINLSTIQEQVREKDEKIGQLEKALKLKGDIIRENEVYYMVDENGQPSGDPLCSNCIEVNFQYVHLVQNIRPRNQSKCPNCNTMYNFKASK